MKIWISGAFGPEELSELITALKRIGDKEPDRKRVL